MKFDHLDDIIMWALILAVAAVWIGFMVAFTYRSHRRPRPQDMLMDDAGRRRQQLR